VLDATHGLLFSSRALLTVTQSTQMTREDAYQIVQSAAMATWEKPEEGNLRQRLEGNPALKAIPKTEWDRVFDAKSFLTHLDKIFGRVAKPDISS
jgi:adenylosuccinate lyase